MWRQDANSTQSFKAICKTAGFGLDSRSAVFLQPNAAQRADPYWNSTNGIAEFIIRQAHKTGPRPGDDALAIFKDVTRWLQREPIEPELWGDRF
jgi:hypothetical protein